MANTPEKRYHINPGKGEKKYTCPYSCYEDGRDAKHDIVPPKGYVLKGFKFVPNSSNKYYDGELIAEYERAPILVRIAQNWVVYLVSLVVIGIILALLYYFGVFSKPKLTEKPSVQPMIVTDSLPVDTLLKSDSTAVLTDSILTTDSVSIPAVDIMESKNEPMAEASVTKEETPVTKEEAPIVKEDVPAPAKEAPSAKENEIVEEQKQNTVQTQEVESPADTPTAQFKQEFWNMIYKQSKQMDSYYSLFTKYKGKVKCKEFDYLRGTILENTTAFKAWKSKLLSIPASELQSITTIDALKQRLK